MSDLVFGPGCHSLPRRKRTGRVIVMEGPDGTGKTNIGSALSLDLKIPYFKFSGEADYWRRDKFIDALRFDQPYLMQLLEQTDYGLIIDRAWPSEFVYSKVFARMTDSEVLKRVDEGFARLGTTIVLTLRHDYVSNRDDELVPKKKLKALHDAYIGFAEWTKCNVIAIYVDGFDDKLMKEVPAIRDELSEINGNFRYYVTLDKQVRKLERIK